MIKVIMIFCLLSEPTECRKVESDPFDASNQMCMVVTQEIAAQWLNDHDPDGLFGLHKSWCERGKDT